MKELEHLNLSFSVHIEFRHSAIESHQNATVFLQGTHEAPNQLIGQPFCKSLTGENR